ncbi:RNA-binding domain-containing protein [Paenibacillus amylolyticus]|uniref:RNA-binding domain-containing protein n=1 Tax=Paenibacillus amylolyticus TaxID=1451 RepID=A0ABD8AWX5_PAEAM
MLEKLNIYNFGPFKTFEMNFNKDITIILGPNASGKTQLLGAIVGVFYGQDSISVNDNTNTEEMRLSLKFKFPDSRVELIRGYTNNKFYVENHTHYISNNKIFRLKTNDINEFEPIIINYKNNLTEFNIELIKKHLLQFQIKDTSMDLLLRIINRIEKTKIKNSYKIHSGGDMYILELLFYLSIALEDKTKLIIIDEFAGMLDSHSASALWDLIIEVSERMQVIISMSGYRVPPLDLEKSIRILPSVDYKKRNNITFNYRFFDSLLIENRIFNSLKNKNKIVKYLINTQVEFEENITMEFKEVKGGNPVDSILSVVDQYVVAYLNVERDTIGTILWGISDDRIVKGVRLNYTERDRLRREIVNKLSQVTPPIPSQVCSISLVQLYDENMNIVTDKYIIEVTVLPHQSEYFFANGKDEVYIKTDGGKRRLKAHELQIELKSRK